MSYTGLFVFLCVAITGVPAPGGHTKICHHCYLVQDPSQCHSFTTCDREEVCFTEIHHQNGENLYTLGCKAHHECEHLLDPIGKRQPATHEGGVVCNECCDTSNCNSHLCGTAITGLPAAGRHTKFCHNCHLVQDPSQCYSFTTCGREEVCFTEVHREHGEYLYTLGCKEHHECEHHHHPHPGPLGAGVVCNECCDTNDCNGHLCAAYHPNATVTHAPTNAPTPTKPDPSTTTTAFRVCRDHHEDIADCSVFDQYNFCTDTTSFAHVIAYEKCPEHCGFCDSDGNYAVVTTTHPLPTTTQAPIPTTQAPIPTTQAPIPTTQAPIPTTQAPIPITQAPIPTTQAPIPTTQAPIPTTQKPIDSMATTWSPQGASIAVTVAPLVTTTSECVDYEDQTFSCAEWTSHGFCTMTSGQGYVIAELRCSKTCGFCS